MDAYLLLPCVFPIHNIQLREYDESTMYSGLKRTVQTSLPHLCSSNKMIKTSDCISNAWQEQELHAQQCLLLGVADRNHAGSVQMHTG